VKVGTDAKASQVETTKPIPNTVAGLNALPSLRDRVPPSNNKFRLPEETRVYVVQGFLGLFKNETDTDYHLVITDASGKYSPGGANTEGQETGTSFIAEIPDPDCTTGAHGDPAVHSVFAAALRATRAKFEARFPEGKGADTYLGIPVTVTGVAFYDRQHLQTGRAVNGIELHPLLDIDFHPDSEPVNETVAQTTELLNNSGFEQGAAGWSGSTGDIGHYTDQPAHAGQQVCWLLGYGKTTTETLSQSVSIPSGVSSATLSFWINVGTEEASGAGPFDFCKVLVRGPTGQLLKTLATFSNLNETADYVQATYDLTQFKGHTIQIVFRASENSANATSFALDDVSLITQ
jgi:hypothetical protein